VFAELEDVEEFDVELDIEFDFDFIV